jgi:hypothetical protein
MSKNNLNYNKGLSLNYNEKLNNLFQFTDEVLKLSSLRTKFHSMIDVNYFSQIDYSISTQLGF